MIKSNRDILVSTQVVAQISNPMLEAPGGFSGGYASTWDGRVKLGIGPGGIKYNVKIGSPCFGWPETESLEPEVALKEVQGIPATPFQSPGSVATTINTVTCIGNEGTLISGDAKGEKGVIVGKSDDHILTHFADETVNKLSIGDKVRIRAEGIGLTIDGFDGNLYNMSPNFLESLKLKLENDKLVFPVAKIIPAYAMGSGSGGSEAQRGNFCIQSCPPELVKELGIGDLKMGDIVALNDILMSYGKSYYRKAITVGVIATGASDNAGHGPGVLAIAASQKGMIAPVLDPKANIAKYLKLV